MRRRIAVAGHPIHSLLARLPRKGQSALSKTTVAIFAVGAAATGIAANMSGLADGISVDAAPTAGFWVFAGFLPAVVVGVLALWRFTTTEGELG